MPNTDSKIRKSIKFMAEEGCSVASIVSAHGLVVTPDEMDFLNGLKASPTKEVESWEPTEKDLESSLFKAIWEAIMNWDIQRSLGKGYAGATGTDVMTILKAIKPILSQSRKEVLEEVEEIIEGYAYYCECEDSCGCANEVLDGIGNGIEDFKLNKLK